MEGERDLVIISPVCKDGDQTSRVVATQVWAVGAEHPERTIARSRRIL